MTKGMFGYSCGVFLLGNRSTGRCARRCKLRIVVHPSSVFVSSNLSLLLNRAFGGCSIRLYLHVQNVTQTPKTINSANFINNTVGIPSHYFQIVCQIKHPCIPIVGTRQSDSSKSSNRKVIIGANTSSCTNMAFAVAVSMSAWFWLMFANPPNTHTPSFRMPL